MSGKSGGTTGALYDTEEGSGSKREREILCFLRRGGAWEIMSVILPVSLQLQRHLGDSVSFSCLVLVCEVMTDSFSPFCYPSKQSRTVDRSPQNYILHL